MRVPGCSRRCPTVGAGQRLGVPQPPVVREAAVQDVRIGAEHDFHPARRRRLGVGNSRRVIAAGAARGLKRSGVVRRCARCFAAANPAIRSSEEPASVVQAVSSGLGVLERLAVRVNERPLGRRLARRRASSSCAPDRIGRSPMPIVGVVGVAAAVRTAGVAPGTPLKSEEDFDRRCPS